MPISVHMRARFLRLLLPLCWLVLPSQASAASAVPLPLGVHEPAPTLFGINTGTYDSNRADFARDIRTARGLGARWVRFTGDSIHWRGDRPNFGVLDSEVTAAKKRGLGVLLSLGGAAPACSLSPRPADVTACPPTTGRDLRAYASFLRTVTLRYRNVVDAYESWLEPNTKSWWRPFPNPAQYAALLKTEYTVFQSLNRHYGLHLNLLFGGPNGFSDIPAPHGSIAALSFVQAVLADLHGVRAFDAVALDAYRYPQTDSGPAGAAWGPDQPEWDYVSGTAASAGGQLWRQMTWSQELTAFEQQFAAQGYPGMALWLTEFGWPGVANPASAPVGEANLYPSFATQAQWLSEAYRELFALPFVKAAFTFNLRDYQPGLANPDPPFFAHYGLLQYDFAPKPAAFVFERLARANPLR